MSALESSQTVNRIILWWVRSIGWRLSWREADLNTVKPTFYA
jgi:hypothetical protein